MEQKREGREGREGRGQRQAERERGGGDLITELFKIVCHKAIMVRFCVLVGSVLLNGHKGRCV